MADMEELRQYTKLADMLIEASSKEDVAETARLLALNVAHYQMKFDELPLDEQRAMLHTNRPNEAQLSMLVSGMETLVGVLGMVRGGRLEDDSAVH
jgi:hypothetical protein